MSHTHKIASDHGLGLNISVPVQIPEIIVNYLAHESKLQCRLVCRNWNLTLLQFLQFRLDLCDSFLQYALHHQPFEQPWQYTLPVTHIIAHDLSNLHLLPILKTGGKDGKFRITDPNGVKKLSFFEGSSSRWKEILLREFPAILELYFSPNSFPIFPSGSGFLILDRLDLNLLKTSENDELVSFLDQATFPRLKTLKLGFNSRQNFQMYASAHYFVGRHWASLQLLKLHLEFGSDYAFSKEEPKLRGSGRLQIFMGDLDSNLTAGFEGDRSRYEAYVGNISRLQLRVFSFVMSIHEGKFPWKLTLDLLESQSNLKRLKVIPKHHSCLSRNSYVEGLIKRNSRSLKQLQIPSTIPFDCRSLQVCSSTLQSLAVGEAYCFGNNPDPQNNLRYFDKLPKFVNIISLSIDVPLEKPEILWMSRHCPTVSYLLVRGIPQEFYAKEEIVQLMTDRLHFKRLMTLASMDGDEKQKLQCWLWTIRELVVVYFFEHINSTLVEFKIQMTRFKFEPYKSLQEKLLHAGEADLEEMNFLA